LSVDHLVELLTLSHQYELTAVRRACVDHLTTSLNASNAVDFLKIGQRLAVTDLSAECFNVIFRGSFDSVSNIDRLEFDDWNSVIHSDRLLISELTLFQSLVQWGKVKLAKRQSSQDQKQDRKLDEIEIQPTIQETKEQENKQTVPIVTGKIASLLTLTPQEQELKQLLSPLLKHIRLNLIRPNALVDIVAPSKLIPLESIVIGLFGQLSEDRFWTAFNENQRALPPQPFGVVPAAAIRSSSDWPGYSAASCIGSYWWSNQETSTTDQFLILDLKEHKVFNRFTFTAPREFGPNRVTIRTSMSPDGPWRVEHSFNLTPSDGAQTIRNFTAAGHYVQFVFSGNIANPTNANNWHAYCIGLFSLEYLQD